MIQAGVSTVFCVLPLVLLNSYPPMVFLRAISLVVLLGLAHGLWVLPCVLCHLPNWLTGGAGVCRDDPIAMDNSAGTPVTMADVESSQRTTTDSLLCT